LALIGGSIDRLRPLLASKLGRDLGLTYLSLGVLAASGLVVNVVVAAIHGAEALGAFNQAYAALMIGAQIATFGMDAVATRQAAHDHSNGDDVGASVKAVSAVALMVAVPISALMLLGLALWADNETRPLLRDLLFPIALGMPAIVLNRVFSGFLNGERRMALYSGIQSARYALLLSAVVGLCVGGTRPNGLGWAFLVAETPPLLFLIFGPYRRSLFSGGSTFRGQLGAMWRFGAASLSGNVIVEINGRVDVIVLSFLADDREVGIYSLSAVIFEGLTQLFAVIQTNLNPIVAKAALERDAEGLRRLVAETARLVYPLFAFVLLVVLALHPLIVNLVIGRDEFMASWTMLAASGAGLLLVAGYLPFRQMMLYLGRPGWFSVQIAVVSAATVLLCLALVPVMQGLGAALAVGLGQVASIAALSVIAARVLGGALPWPWSNAGQASSWRFG
jgi:O-antigen/teichoic acid export membrane protein